MLANWTKATTTTTGTGNLSLTAITNFPLPSKSKLVGETIGYCIVTSDNKLETGIGTTVTGDVLARTKVLSTFDGTTYTNAGATALTLTAGTHTVYFSDLTEQAFMALPYILSGPTNAAVFSTHFNSGQANVTTAAVQRNTAYPFRLETTGYLIAMAVNVGGAQASATALLGLYEAGSNGRPSKLLAATSAPLDCSTTGWKSQAVSTNIRLTPGWYWAALCITSSGSNPSFTGGSTTTHSAFGGQTNGAVIMNYRSDTTATSMADPFPTGSPIYIDSSGGYSGSPFIGLIMS